MKLIKKLSAKTFEGSDNKKHHYINYLLELDNGKRVLVKCVNKDDYKTLDGVAYFENSNTKDE